MKHIFNKYCFVISLIFFMPVSAFADNNESISLPVNELHNTLLEVMKLDGKEQFESRVKLLEPVVSNSFDFTYIARIVTGREWKKLEEADQQRFISLFHTLTVATYAKRFDAYNNETFITSSVEPLKNNRHLVRTTLNTTDETVSLDYIVQEDDSNWKIINVVANGVSDLSLKRTEYRKLIKESGFEYLLEEIQAQITAQKQ